MFRIFFYIPGVKPLYAIWEIYSYFKIEFPASLFVLGQKILKVELFCIKISELLESH